MESLLSNITKLHTTPLGRERITHNLNLHDCDVVDLMKNLFLKDSAIIERNGKNYYITIEECKITVNAHNFTIITAHKIKIHRQYAI